MAEVDLKAESVNNYIAEFLQEIDQQFLDPNFSTLDYVVNMVAHSQTRDDEKKERAFLVKQTEIIEKCLLPVVQAYYADYNNSLSNLTAICDDFRKNQKEVEELAKRVCDVQTRLSSNSSGIQQLYYEKLLTEYTLKSLKNIEYIRQAPKIVDSLLENSLYIRASNLFNEIFTLLSDPSIATVPSVVALQDFWDMKKKDMENTLMDRLLTVVYHGDTLEWSSYTDEHYNYHDLTEEKEKELISNNKYTCSKYSAIAIIIKAATLLGCNLAAQNRLHSNTVGNLNEIILKSVNQTVTRVEDPKDPLKKGKDAVEYALKRILITCDDVFRTHICCIEAFLNSVVAANLDYSTNINPSYNVMAVFSAIQVAIQSFMDKFITMPTTSSTVTALKLTKTNNSKGMRVSFSFASSPAWISSQQTVLSDLKGKMYDNSLYTRVSEPDMLLISVIHFYAKSFIDQATVLANESVIRITEMKAGLQVIEEPPDLSELTRLSDYLNNHIDSDLHPALLGRGASLIQAALGKPESYLINEDDGHTLNAVLELKQAWDELENGVLLLHSNYYDVIDTLSELIDGVCSKFTTLIDEMIRGSFAQRRRDWAGNGANLLLFNNPKYAAILDEIPHFPKFEYKHLTEKEMEDEETAINGDIFSFFIDPPVEKKHLLLNGRVILLCNMCEGCKQMMEHILEKRVIRHENQDSKSPIDFGVYDETVDKCVLALKVVMDSILQVLQNEINSRCFYYFQKLNESFTSNSYNNVPPVIMELMKDMKGFSDIIIRLCSRAKIDLLGNQLHTFLSKLLMRSITHIPVEEVDASIISTLKQSSVCCSQIMNLLLPIQETIAITRHLTDYFSLALMTAEEIRTYISKHPRRFTNIDYMNLFKITTPNRERDDAAIDWIEEIIRTASKKERKHRK